MPPIRTQKTTSVGQPSHPYAGHPAPSGHTVKSEQGEAWAFMQQAESPQVKVENPPTQQNHSKQPKQPKSKPEPKSAPLGKGVRAAAFRSNLEWEKHRDAWLGTATTSITFGSSFVLKPEHLHHIASLPRVCNKLTHFTFVYNDVSYGATNSASDVDDESVIRLAEACPKLRQFILPGASDVKERGLIALFENCDELREVDIYSTFDGTPFEVLKNIPDRLPMLKRLRIKGFRGNTQKEKAANMKPMREATAARPKFCVQIMSRVQTKRHGDWDLDEDVHEHYEKGKQATTKYRDRESKKDARKFQDWMMSGGW
ncbi:hypothetical protein CkaCkLH20_08643 [Colletotrichum karsti]|uniref:F-box domain-containing protein n=1 Tax=Colletotrichum karsti TaxID=1095194 RepID=A0A9P6I0N5_9PEZI|nr:uncharacterized protein CkaCkLH20_08643 [Colletotrichum karsti]KAF9873909.1 hypothetical protein CkaCkLH20_08643 [Colletotrichum karsti]